MRRRTRRSIMHTIATLALLVSASGPGCGWKSFVDPIGGGDVAGDGSGGMGSGEESGDGECDAGCVPWCDPATWGGELPDPQTDVVIAPGDRVVVDCDATVRSVTVEEGGTLLASRSRSAVLTVQGNVVVRGRMDWGSPLSRIPDGVAATVRLSGIDNATFVGQLDPAGDVAEPGVIPQDTGVWVVGNGVLTAAGAPTSAWATQRDPLSPSDLSVRPDRSEGWRPGDALVLTPSGRRDDPSFTTGFSAATIAASSDGLITLAAAPEAVHDGCPDCLRRTQIINATRNVVIGADATGGYGHIYVAQSGVLQLDSVAVEHMGPAWPAPRCGGPSRRSAIYFDRQGESSTESELRHVLLRDSRSGFVHIESSNGITLEDVAGYDGLHHGFWIGYRKDHCGEDCPEPEALAPTDVTLADVLVARLGARPRDGDCSPIAHRLSGFMLGGHDGSVCRGCVGVGVGSSGGGEDVAVFSVIEGQHGRPTINEYRDLVAHNSKAHGVFVWHAEDYRPEPFEALALWSLQGAGIFSGGKQSGIGYTNLTISDTGRGSVELRSAPAFDAPRFREVAIERLVLARPAADAEGPHHLAGVTFTSTAGDDPAVTRDAEDCPQGDPTDIDDPDCRVQRLRIDGAAFPAGVVPFWFGPGGNQHSTWEIRGFSHPDYAELPADFDLLPPDAPSAEGSPMPQFDARLVPR